MGLFGFGGGREESNLVAWVRASMSDRRERIRVVRAIGPREVGVVVVVVDVDVQESVVGSVT